MKRRSIFLFLAGFILLLFLYSFYGIPGGTLLSRYILSPVQSLAWKSGVFVRQVFQYSRFELLQQITKLEEERAQLLVEKSSYLLTEQENALLRSMVQFSEKTQYDLRLARVIGRTIDLQGATLLLDRGLDDDVRIGLPVIVHDGIIIGKIIKAERAFSHLQLVTHPQSSLASMLLNEQKTPGLVQGERSLSAAITFIPRDYALQGNEFIVTSGLEPLIPPGLFIGTVERITTQSSDLFQSASIELPVSFDSLLYVSIILPL